jgi:cysteine desulfurase/selenocysteine lyase
LNYLVHDIRKDFPILARRIYKKPLVYLDNAATTQKPKAVLDEIVRYYTHTNSNIHRGVHHLSEQATEDYENARKTVRKFIHAQHDHEIIFTSGTTSSVNGLAFSFAEKYLSTGDEVIVTEMEHHAVIVPWQMACERKNAKLKVIPFNDDGTLQVEALKGLISERTKIVAVIHVSNALGTINPIQSIIDIAHRYDIPVFVDAAQSVQHIPLDVQELDCDFLAFSGHKTYGPTGIGVLYGKEKWLDVLPPFLGGGDMVDVVTFEKTTYDRLPFKFEAGTTNYIGAAGLSIALQYINNIGLNNIQEYEQSLHTYGHDKLNEIDGLKLYGHAKNKTSVLSFLLKGVHPLDAGMILDKMGIALRTGTHCTQPIMQHYGIDGTIRASLGMYNTKEEIDYLCTGLKKVMNMFAQ